MLPHHLNFEPTQHRDTGIKSSLGTKLKIRAFYSFTLVTLPALDFLTKDLLCNILIRLRLISLLTTLLFTYLLILSGFTSFLHLSTHLNAQCNGVWVGGANAKPKPHFFSFFFFFFLYLYYIIYRLTINCKLRMIKKLIT